MDLVIWLGMPSVALPSPVTDSRPCKLAHHLYNTLVGAGLRLTQRANSPALSAPPHRAQAL